MKMNPQNDRLSGASARDVQVQAHLSRLGVAVVVVMEVETALGRTSSIVLALLLRELGTTRPGSAPAPWQQDTHQR